MTKAAFSGASSFNEIYPGNQRSVRKGRKKITKTGSRAKITQPSPKRVKKLNYGKRYEGNKG